MIIKNILPLNVCMELFKRFLKCLEDNGGYLSLNLFPSDKIRNLGPNRNANKTILENIKHFKLLKSRE